MQEVKRINCGNDTNNRRLSNRYLDFLHLITSSDLHFSGSKKFNFQSVLVCKAQQKKRKNHNHIFISFASLLCLPSLLFDHVLMGFT